MTAPNVGTLTSRRWRTVLRRPLTIVSVAYLAAVAAAAVAAAVLAPYDPTATDLDHVLSGPDAAHLLGTDSLGRDVLSRLLYGGRITLAGVAEAVLTVLVLGVSAGLLAGVLGGWVDRAIAWVTDVMLAVPIIVTLLMVLAVIGSNEAAAMIALGVLGAPGLARVVRGATLAVRHELYVVAAQVAGLSTTRIVVGQVLPRVAGPIIVQGSIFAGTALLTETGLGYLGLGVQPPTPTWGGLVADASTVIDQQPWLLVPSGVVIGLAILAFGLLGDAVRDVTAGHSSQGASSRRRSTPPPVASSAGGADQATAGVPMPDTSSSALLTLRGVAVALPTEAGWSTVVEGLTMEIRPGETVGVVGESGCGKTITGLAILGLVPAGGRITAGSILFDGHELTTATERVWAGIRGSQIALVSQEPQASLDPVVTVGDLVGEMVRRHHGGSRRSIRARTVELLDSVNLPNPPAVVRRYPHELSGGMAQRVAVALALAGNPKLLIADEPTTALDVSVQAEILDLLRRLQADTGMAILLISHDWGVVADLCQRAHVMYAGHLVESADVQALFDRPRHPYTAALLGAAPRRALPRRPLPAIPGTVPDPRRWPVGCHFVARCSLATAECSAGPVALRTSDPSHLTRCLHHDQVSLTTPTAAGRPG